MSLENWQHFIIMWCPSLSPTKFLDLKSVSQINIAIPYFFWLVLAIGISFSIPLPKISVFICKLGFLWVGEPQWVSDHPTLLLAMGKLFRSEGKGSSAFTPASAPLEMPCHLLEGTSILPRSPLCLGAPESPSAPLAPPTTPTLHCMAHPPQHTYRGLPHHGKSRNSKWHTPS